MGFRLSSNEKFLVVGHEGVYQLWQNRYPFDEDVWAEQKEIFIEQLNLKLNKLSYTTSVLELCQSPIIEHELFDKPVCHQGLLMEVMTIRKQLAHFDVPVGCVFVCEDIVADGAFMYLIRLQDYVE